MLHSKNTSSPSLIRKGSSGLPRDRRTSGVSVRPTQMFRQGGNNGVKLLAAGAMFFIHNILILNGSLNLFGYVY